MTESKRGPVLSSLTGNLAVFVLLPLLLNGAIFGLGWDRKSASATGPMEGIPPGWVVGAIWMVLFTGMGVARWLLIKRGAGRLIEGPSLVASLCLLYPLYTSGLQDNHVGLIGNVATAAVAVPIAAMVWGWSRAASVCLAAACFWLFYAAAATAYALYR
jgi:hypothetical protein